MSNAHRILESALIREQFPLGEIRETVSHTRPPEVENQPYYYMVPKQLTPQLFWREYVRLRCREDKRFRHAVVQACEEDFLFFMNTMCWVFEPRLSVRLPLNTWADQDCALVWMEECFGRRDCGVEKSRGIGFSWNIVALAYWHWFFDDLCQIGLVSRKEGAVDSADDPDALMWKLDYIHDNMPAWWRLDSRKKKILKRTYSDHRFHNLIRESTIIGYEATGNVMTGGRKTAIFLDEFGKFDPGQDQFALDSTQHVSNSRYFISTFKGDQSSFYRMMRMEQTSMLKIIADWKQNEERARGLYRSESGRVKIYDPNYKYPPDYKFVTDGKWRSPWYDAECNRPGATPASIAEEIERDPRGSVAKFFTSGFLEHVEGTVKEPTTRGMATVDDDGNVQWTPRPDGTFSWWVNVTSGGDIEYGGPYAIGCDISLGTGNNDASYSAMSIIDTATGEQIGEWYCNKTPTVDFAQLAVATCKWLSRDRGETWAYLNFESNGVGGIFRNEIKRLNYGNVYCRINEKLRGKKRTADFGWHNQDAGEVILADLQRASLANKCKIRSRFALADSRCYQYSNGRLVNAAANMADDDSSSARSHGDRIIALGITWLAACDRPASHARQEHREQVNEIRELERQGFPTNSIDKNWLDAANGHQSEWWPEVADSSLILL